MKIIIKILSVSISILLGFIYINLNASEIETRTMTYNKDNLFIVYVSNSHNKMIQCQTTIFFDSEQGKISNIKFKYDIKPYKFKKIPFNNLLNPSHETKCEIK